MPKGPWTVSLCRFLEPLKQRSHRYSCGYRHPDLSQNAERIDIVIDIHGAILDDELILMHTCAWTATSHANSASEHTSDSLLFYIGSKLFSLCLLSRHVCKHGGLPESRIQLGDFFYQMNPHASKNRGEYKTTGANKQDANDMQAELMPTDAFQ